MSYSTVLLLLINVTVVAMATRMEFSMRMVEKYL